MAPSGAHGDNRVFVKQIGQIESMPNLVSVTLCYSDQPFQTTIGLHGQNGAIHTLHAKLDCGSSHSVIMHYFFDSQLPAVPLKCLKGPSYSVENICVLNFDMAVANGCKCSLDLVVLPADVTPLLGWDLICGLGLTIQGIPPSPPDSSVCASSSGWKSNRLLFATDFPRCP